MLYRNLSWLLVAVGSYLNSAADAMERVSLQRDGKPIHVSGKILVESQDGGLLLLDEVGTLWMVQPDEITRRETDPVPFRPVSAEQQAARLRQELPGCQIHRTNHYVICYNTSEAFAKWTGALYERLFKAFDTYWGHRRFQLHEP